MNLLLPFLLLSSTLNVRAAPPIFNDDGSTQVVLSGMHRGAKASSTPGWSDHPKASVLTEKKKSEEWIHDSKEYVQQNNILCAYESFQMLMSSV